MVNCLQYYLKNGLVNNEFGNLLTRKFIVETAHEFFEWCKEGNIKLNERLYKGTIFEDFVNEYPDFKKFLSQKKFKKWLELYAIFVDAKYTEGRGVDGRYFQLSKDIIEPMFKTEVPF
jgi:hypothetical protein